MRNSTRCFLVYLERSLRHIILMQCTTVVSDYLGVDFKGGVILVRYYEYYPSWWRMRVIENVVSRFFQTSGVQQS